MSFGGDEEYKGPAANWVYFDSKDEMVNHKGETIYREDFHDCEHTENPDFHDCEHTEDHLNFHPRQI